MSRKARLSLLWVVAVLAMSVASCASEEPSDSQALPGARSEAALQSLEVSAGADVSRWANEPLTLNGAVLGDAGEPTLSWSFALAEGTDPAATCTFDAPGAASTTVSCTHEGTYTVMLTANDGVSAPATALPGCGASQARAGTFPRRT